MQVTAKVVLRATCGSSPACHGGLAPQLAELIKSKLGYKYHYAIADYLMRAARHIASKTDVEQSYAVGKAAVEFALAGQSGVMVAIERQSDAPYRWTIGTAPLEQVANVEKKMPRDFITLNDLPRIALAATGSSRWSSSITRTRPTRSSRP